MPGYPGYPGYPGRSNSLRSFEIKINSFYIL